ncbi:MAG TPA: hypothetical protein VNJ28_03005 [Candidatus Limnocylindrales bacterium]|nr:hypothetical protein [Candidatus Limnocylindrales bacterium]
MLSALAILVGCLLPWFGVGGEGGLPARELRAFDGSGILAFLAGLATIALAALPYAAGDRPVGVDRALAYAILAGAAAVGLALWPLTLLDVTLAGLVPTRAPGFWIAIAGALGLARASWEIAREPGRD